MNSPRGPASPQPDPGATRPVQPSSDDIARLLGPLGWHFLGHSALEQFFRKPASHWISLAVHTDLVGLARQLPGLEYPGIDQVDAALSHNGQRYWLHCTESLAPTLPVRSVVPGFNLLMPANLDRHQLLDPLGVAGTIRSKDWAPAGRLAPGDIPDLAIFAARFLSGMTAGSFSPLPGAAWPAMTAEELRRLLGLVLTGPRAALGLAILARTGFMDHHFPELSDLDQTEHSKEGHPEGNVWNHSLDCLDQRKTLEEDLGLALLLHDCGKPLAKRSRQRMFDGHAELGARRARQLLERLGYPAGQVARVCWLVEHHMIPQALDVLPLSRTEHLMANELFPWLLELYRCDLSSTYRGPDGYYEACKRFRNWLRNSRNPWITLDRKRLIQRFVANS